MRICLECGSLLWDTSASCPLCSARRWAEILDDEVRLKSTLLLIWSTRPEIMRQSDTLLAAIRDISPALSSDDLLMSALLRVLREGALDVGAASFPLVRSVLVGGRHPYPDDVVLEISEAFSSLLPRMAQDTVPVREETDGSLVSAVGRDPDGSLASAVGREPDASLARAVGRDSITLIGSALTNARLVELERVNKALGLDGRGNSLRLLRDVLLSGAEGTGSALNVMTLAMEWLRMGPDAPEIEAIATLLHGVAVLGNNDAEKALRSLRELRGSLAARAQGSGIAVAVDEPSMAEALAKVKRGVRKGSLQGVFVDDSLIGSVSRYLSPSRKDKLRMLVGIFDVVSSENMRDTWRDARLWEGTVQASLRSVELLGEASFVARFVGSILCARLSVVYDMNPSTARELLVFVDLWNGWVREARMGYDTLKGMLTLSWSHDFGLDGGKCFDARAFLLRSDWLALLSAMLYAVRAGNCSAREAMANLGSLLTHMDSGQMPEHMMRLLGDAGFDCRLMSDDGRAVIAVSRGRQGSGTSHELQLSGCCVTCVRSSAVGRVSDEARRAVGALNAGLVHGLVWLEGDLLCVAISSFHWGGIPSEKSVRLLMSAADDLLENCLKRTGLRGRGDARVGGRLSAIALSYGNGEARARFGLVGMTRSYMGSGPAAEGCGYSFPMVVFMPETRLARWAMIVALRDGSGCPFAVGETRRARLFGYADVGVDALMAQLESPALPYADSRTYRMDLDRYVTQVALFGYVARLGGRVVSPSFERSTSDVFGGMCEEIATKIRYAQEVRNAAGRPFATPSDGQMSCLYVLEGTPWMMLVVRMSLSEVGEASRLSG